MAPSLFGICFVVIYFLVSLINKIVINCYKISVSKFKIELHTTDNAWKPDRMAKPGKDGEANGEETEMQTLERKARSILNKLTPQKFDTLIGKFQELGVNSEEKLQRWVTVT